MNFVPENRTVLCKMIVKPKQETALNGIFYTKDDLPEYRIVRVSDDIGGWLSEGDIVVCNSTGTEIREGDISYFLFKMENIAAKILGT